MYSGDVTSFHPQSTNLPWISCGIMKYILFWDVTPGSLVDNYDWYADLSIAQKARSRLLNGGGGLPQVNSCGICDGCSGTGTIFLRLLRLYLPIIIPPNAPLLSSIIRGRYSGLSTKRPSLVPSYENKNTECDLRDQVPYSVLHTCLHLPLIHSDLFVYFSVPLLLTLSITPPSASILVSAISAPL